MRRVGRSQADPKATFETLENGHSRTVVAEQKPGCGISYLDQFNAKFRRLRES